MTITITKTENGFEVKLPFELKDSFKKAIPSAKWNGFKKVWEIGPRSGKKAQIWAEQAQVVAKALDEKKEREATEAEFEEALNDIKALEREILAEQEKSKALDEILATLESAKSKVQEAKAELEKEKQAVADKTAKINAVLESIIDMSAVRNAKQTMSRLQGKMTSANRKEFEAAQAVINEQRKKLAAAGLGSRGLDDLWYVNWNRPDRDTISRCRNVIEIYQLEPE